jgi:hypothetical protein
VWERFWSAIDRDVHYQLVNPDGTREFGLTGLIDNSTSTLDTRPSVSKSNGNPSTGVRRWNVAWQREVTPTNHDIRGAQVRWDGTLDTLTFPISTGTSDDTNPSASSPLDGSGTSRLWMVAFERNFTTDHDVEGIVLNGSTLVTSANLSLLDNDTYLEDQILPCADSDGNEFAVSWNESFNGSTSDYDPYVQSYYASARRWARATSARLSPSPVSRVAPADRVDVRRRRRAAPVPRRVGRTAVRGLAPQHPRRAVRRRGRRSEDFLLLRRRHRHRAVPVRHGRSRTTVVRARSTRPARCCSSAEIPTSRPTRSR